MTIPVELVAEARAAAVAGRRRLVDVLEERLGLDPDAFTARLSLRQNVLPTPSPYMSPSSQHGISLSLNFECSCWASMTSFMSAMP